MYDEVRGRNFFEQVEEALSQTFARRDVYLDGRRRQEARRGVDERSFVIRRAQHVEVPVHSLLRREFDKPAAHLSPLQAQRERRRLDLAPLKREREGTQLEDERGGDRGEDERGDARARRATREPRRAHAREHGEADVADHRPARGESYALEQEHVVVQPSVQEEVRAERREEAPDSPDERDTDCVVARHRIRRARACRVRICDHRIRCARTCRVRVCRRRICRRRVLRLRLLRSARAPEERRGLEPEPRGERDGDDDQRVIHGARAEPDQLMSEGAVGHVAVAERERTHDCREHDDNVERDDESSPAPRL